MSGQFETITRTIYPDESLQEYPQRPPVAPPEVGANEGELPPGASDLPSPEHDGISSKYRFTPVSHPHARLLSEMYDAYGAGGVLRPDAYLEDGVAASSDLRMQSASDFDASAADLDASEAGLDFSSEYNPNSATVVSPLPRRDFDFREASRPSEPGVPTSELAGHFRPGSPSAIYNWELFFHLPTLLAKRLGEEGRYEEARKALHAVFDPTRLRSTDPVEPERMWRFGPFVDPEARGLAGNGLDLTPGVFQRWMARPFDPHATARVRWVTYKRAVVLQYVENLIEWADSLFRVDTRESIREAGQLYFMALEVLGPRRREVEVRAATTRPSFRSLRSQADTSLDEAPPTVLPGGGAIARDEFIPESLWTLPTPGNPRWEELRAQIADRLFKIRNSLTIDGEFRELRLFQPPIDPAALVRAFAMGVDIADLSDVVAPLRPPPMRFRATLSLARVLANEVRSLGGGLLSASEKRDEARLQRLRADQDVDMAKRVRSVRDSQVEQARESVKALNVAVAAAEARRDYYQELLDASLIEEEEAQLDQQILALKLSAAATAVDVGSSILLAIGTITAGSEFTVETGPNYVGQALGQIATTLRTAGGMHQSRAGLAGINASHARRAEEWTFQLEQAQKEVKRTERQLEAARIQERIAAQERDNQIKAVSDREAVRDYLSTRYTNEELYDWMASELRWMHERGYSLAFDIARRAERAYQHEIGDPSVRFLDDVVFGTGVERLLAGERLVAALNRMEAKYQEDHVREYELTKHVSLATWDPTALQRLRETGECFFQTTDAMFDIDGPGHVRRRIQRVAVSLPCVRGPYDSVPCKVTLLSSRYRLRAGSTSFAAAQDGEFVSFDGAPVSIVTSHGVQDSGVVVSAQDERFLPFEGHGATGQWRLQLPKGIRPFDYRTISDVVLHITYSARDGGEAYRAQVEAALPDALRNQATGFPILARSLRHDDPTAWLAFKADTQDDLTFTFSSDEFALTQVWGTSGEVQVDVVILDDGKGQGTAGVGAATADVAFGSETPVALSAFASTTVPTMLSAGDALSLSTPGDALSVGLGDIGTTEREGIQDILVLVRPAIS